MQRESLDVITEGAEPAAGRVWRIGLVLCGTEPDEAEQTALDFCARGRSVELVPLRSLDSPAHPLDAIVSLGSRTPPAAPSVPVLRVTDNTGADLTDSLAVAEAIRRNAGSVEIQIRDGLGSVLAQGLVSTRRTTEHTRLQMLRTAGPLLVMAAREFPLPAMPSRPPLAAQMATSGQRRAANAMGLLHFTTRTMTRATTALQWRVAKIPGPDPLRALVQDGNPPPAPLSWQTAPLPDFWADPFVLNGEPSLLFVEELNMSTGRGVIRLLEISGTEVLPGPVVLRTDHHLSYPQLYRAAQGWLATVETCERHNPIYTFDAPGEPWRPADLPALPPHLGDPVLTFHEDGTVAGVVGTDAQTDADSVIVRYDLDRSSRTWLRHDDSVRVSVVNGRGGGTLDSARSWRATQDCAGTYGRAVEVLRIRRGRSPETLRRITPDSLGVGTDGKRPSGVHTLSWTADGSELWCDSWIRRPTPLGWLWDMRERSHLSSCQG